MSVLVLTCVSRVPRKLHVPRGPCLSYGSTLLLLFFLSLFFFFLFSSLFLLLPLSSWYSQITGPACFWSSIAFLAFLAFLAFPASRSSRSLRSPLHVPRCSILLSLPFLLPFFFFLYPLDLVNLLVLLGFGPHSRSVRSSHSPDSSHSFRSSDSSRSPLFRGPPEFFYQQIIVNNQGMKSREACCRITESRSWLPDKKKTGKAVLCCGPRSPCLRSQPKGEFFSRGKLVTRNSPLSTLCISSK